MHQLKRTAFWRAQTAQQVEIGEPAPSHPGTARPVLDSDREAPEHVTGENESLAVRPRVVRTGGFRPGAPDLESMTHR